jgi:hypothetical protein
MINLKSKRPAGELYAQKADWQATDIMDYVLITDDEDLMRTTCDNMDKCTHYQKELTDRNYQIFYSFPKGFDDSKIFRPPTAYIRSYIYEKIL